MMAPGLLGHRGSAPGLLTTTFRPKTIQTAKCMACGPLTSAQGQQACVASSLQLWGSLVHRGLVWQGAEEPAMGVTGKLQILP